MKELIKRLCEGVAPSGSEHGLQEQLLDLVRDVADDVLIDRLGNAIATKQGKGPHIMLAAHADEAGLMVIDIDDKGFVRLISVGNVKPSTLIGRHVVFTNGVLGVVGVEHDVKIADVQFNHLFVDLGAQSKEEASSRVHVGLSGVVSEPVVELSEHTLAGRALDNRVGCAIALEAFKQAADAGRHVSVVFTAQHEVGARGAKTAAFRVQPDVALVIDAVPAGDAPNAARMEVSLGKGPAIKIMDGTAIIPLEVKDQLIDAAAKASIDVQYEVWPRGFSDTGAIHLSVDGIPVGGVSYPARYAGGPTTVVDVRDAENALELIQEYIKAQG